MVIFLMNVNAQWAVILGWLVSLNEHTRRISDGGMKGLAIPPFKSYIGCYHKLRKL
jgi:hypothetical protein